ncbi:MAG: FAD-dependent oxidoreductase, partial [Planctomycetales bacterium]|nr:FAD-dependent oxidoreductase [Planctomycetales bacterium]
MPAKPLGAFAERWEAHVAKAETDGGDVLIIGAGVAGVELALAAKHRLQASGVVARVTLLETGDAPLRDIGAGARAALTAQLKEQGVSLRAGAQVAEVTPA